MELQAVICKVCGAVTKYFGERPDYCSASCKSLDTGNRKHCKWMTNKDGSPKKVNSMGAKMRKDFQGNKRVKNWGSIY